MEYISVYEVANQLNVSHTTIYNKLNDKQIYKEIKPFIKKSGKTKLIGSEAISIIAKYINIKETELKHEIKNDIQHLDKSLIESLENRIKELEKDKEHLRSEIEVKNRQIENNSRLLENSQILLRESQQKILMLESKPEPENFFKRLFKR